MRTTFFALLLALPFTALAQQNGLGLGIIVGEPTGLSFKQWIGGDKAVDGAIAWSFREPGSLHIHADHLWHKFELINVSTGKLPLYFGVGGRIRFANDAELGIRLPVGLAYLFDGAPVDVFLEVVPILDLVPASDVSFNGAFGARYYF